MTRKVVLRPTCRSYLPYEEGAVGCGSWLQVWLPARGRGGETQYCVMAVDLGAEIGEKEGAARADHRTGLVQLRDLLLLDQRFRAGRELPRGGDLFEIGAREQSLGGGCAVDRLVPAL